jgi:hypothetical protein
MELVAWLSGERHSDEPSCACPVLGAFVRAFNDLLPDDDAREHYLRPLAPRLVNTKANAATERARAFLAADCAVRFFGPLRLAALGRHADAELLRALPAVVDRATAAVGAAAALRAGPALRAAAWTAAQAAADRPPRLWVAGAVHAARSARAWQGARRLLEDMVIERVPTA